MVLVFGVPAFLSAQVFLVEGTIVDEQTLDPVPYASINVVGSSSGTSSNADGSFALKVPELHTFKKFSIKISCIGYENLIVDSPTETLAIRLKPTRTILKEVIVFGKDLTPQKIVQRAFDNIPRNYNSKPFVYRTFYRHYCRDDDVYGRLIEAAVEVYKRKGYRIMQTYPGSKDEVRVTQLRRSFDNTKVNTNHVPIALYNILATDIAGYQSNMKSSDDNWIASMGFQEVSGLKKYINLFRFDFRGITAFDNEEVYEIDYRLKADTIRLSSGLAYPIDFHGTLFITTNSYAFVKAESIRATKADTLATTALYQRNGNKYYLYHAIREGKSFSRQLNFQHAFRIELITTDILTRDFPVFEGKEPGKETLFTIPFDTTFWERNNTLKATPLEEEIVADLERSSSLSDQFKTYRDVEQERYLSGKEDEARFNLFVERNHGRVLYLSFWASTNKTSVSELTEARKIVEKFKSKIAFVHLSVDDDILSWKETLRKNKLESPYVTHFRIGPDSDAAKLFDFVQVPHYVLVDRKGFFVDQDARRPDDPELEKDFLRLLSETID